MDYTFPGYNSLVRVVTASLAILLVTALGLALPPRALAQAPGGLSLTVFSATHLGPNQTTSVLVGVEMAGVAPTPASLPRQIVVRMTDEAATPPEHIVTVALADDQAVARAVRDGVRVLARMTLTPGHHAVRIDVLDGSATASAVHVVDVPDLRTGFITMSPLVVTASRVAGITQADSEDDGKLPILAQPATGRRQFARGERVEVNTEIYGAVSDPIDDAGINSFTIATTVFTADGTVVHEFVEGGSSELLDSGEYGYRHYTLVPIGTLPPGAYVIRVAALWNTAVAASQSMAVTVVPD